MLRSLYVVVCGLLLMAGYARAATTINVGPGQTYTTIQSGINAANNGDTVSVAPGTYYENIDFKGKAITVTSSGGATSTIIDASNTNYPAVVFKTSEMRGSVLNGFTVQGGGQELYYGNMGGIVMTNAAPTLSNNTITHNHCYSVLVSQSSPLIENNEIDNTLDSHGDCSFGGGAAIYVSGSLQSTNTGTAPLLTITGNTLQNNTQSGLEDAGGNGGAGVAFWGGDALIENNIIRNNASPGGSGGGINVQGGGTVVIAQNLIYGNQAGCGGGGLAIEGAGGYAPAMLVVNNTIVDNSNGTGGGFSECAPISQFYPSPDSYGTGNPALVFVNNIISGSTTYPAVNCSWFDVPSEAIQPIFDHSLLLNAGGVFFGSYCVDVSGKYGNIVADPQFVDAAAGNYQLNAGSPAIDSGNTSALQLLNALNGTTITQDLAGNSRLQDATGKGYPVIDMGAYEYGGVVDATPTTVELASSAYTGNAGSNFTLTATLSSKLGIPTGSVTFFMDGAQVGTSTISAGVAPLPNVIIKPGVHSLYAAYAGQGSFTPATSVIVIVNINKYASTLTLKSVPNPSLVGQNVTFTLTSASADTTYIPSPIVLTDGSTTLTTLTPDNSGNATFQISSLALGYHSINASFAGDSQHSAASANVLQDVVSGYPSSVKLSSSSNPSIQNQPVTFTAQVTTSASGVGTPAGSIMFTYGTTALGTVTMDATGTASVSTSTLPLGNDTITATYQPSNSFVTGSAMLTQQVISGYPTTASLASSLNPATPRQTVTFTAHVSSQTSSIGLPTGSVTFEDGTAVVATVPLVAGVATWSSSALSDGTHQMSATFVPTGNFSASAASLAEVVGYPTVTTTSVAPNPSLYGQPVVFNAHVAGTPASAGVPTGFVLFQYCHGATVRLALDANGNASYTSPLSGAISEPVGSCSYTVAYQGDTNFLPSTSASTSYVVNPATSTTTVTGTPNPGYAGQSVLLSAQVQGVPSPTLGPGGTLLPPGAQSATGTVQFFDGGVAIGSGNLNASGVATIMTSALALGLNGISAVYAGDSNLTGSTSAVVTVTIQLDPTTTVLTVTPNPGVQNEPISMTANIMAAAGTPAGTVSFFDGTIPLSSMTLPANSFTTSSLAPGTHSLLAVYTPAVVAGVADFIGSQSAVVSLTIAPQDFTLTANPSLLAIEIEHHGSLTLTLTSIGGFAAPMTLTCGTSLPEYLTCELPDKPVSLAANASVPVTLTLDTDVILDFKSETRSDRLERVVLAGLFPLALLGLSRRRKGLRLLSMLVLLMIVTLGTTACSGKYPAHVAVGSYTIPITATGTPQGGATAVSHTLSISLNVTPE